ncbi:MAG: ABC transporter permease [Aureliella sp.]
MNVPIAAKSQTARGLRWKETRQLLPLCGMLAALAIGMHLIVLLPISLLQMNTDTSRAIVTSLAIGLPGLFAVGAGAILVGQEKDQRTLMWLNSLPISSSQLVRTKLTLSLVALVAMWIVSFALLFVFGQFPVREAGAFWEGILSWPLHTLFLLLAGFALAWKLSTAFGALIALIPVALLPGLVASAITVMSDATPRVDYFASSPVLIGCQVVACVLAAIWCLRSAHSALGPAPAPRVKTVTSEQRFLTSSLGSPQPRMSALTWQAAKQNAYWLVGCASMLLVALSVLLLDSSQDPSKAVLLPLAYLLIFCSISWLGVSVFQGDQLHNRIRFLADRGVQPWRVWITRQAAPIAILLAAAVLGAGVLFRSNLGGSLAGNAIIFAGFCGLGLTTYAVSQWLSQIARSPIVAAVGAPPASAGVLVYLSMATTNLGAPIWLAALCVAAGLLVTCTLCRRWMDSTRDRKFWLTNTALCTAIFALPLVPLGYTYATLERADAAAIAEIHALAPIVDTRTYGKPISPDFSAENVNAALQEMRPDKRRLETVKLLLQDHAGPIAPEGPLLGFLSKEIQLGRMHLDTGNTDRQEWYRECVDVTLKIIFGLRQNHRLRIQDYADQLEILLTKQMVFEDAREHLGEQLYAKVARQIGDRDARSEARLRSIAAALKNLERDIKEGDAYYFGSYRMNRPSSDVLANMQFLPKAQTMAQQLWQLAKAGDDDTTDVRQSLAEFWHVSESMYGLGTNGKYYRADQLDAFFASNMTYAPGQQWNAKWESIAAEFGNDSDLER